jgi:hypothetical protein
MIVENVLSSALGLGFMYLHPVLVIISPLGLLFCLVDGYGVGWVFTSQQSKMDDTTAFARESGACENDA